jgi:hypothetical protein
MPSDELSAEFYRGAKWFRDTYAICSCKCGDDGGEAVFDLLATAEAREAVEPSAAEVIEALNTALVEMYNGACGRIGTSQAAAKHSRQLKALFVYQQYRDQLARWKEAHGGK